MLFILGILIVVTSILIGYMMHLGDLSLLWQPNELIIIIGAAIGSCFIANPWSLVKGSIKALANLFRGAPYKKADYLELLLFFFNITRLIKTKGLIAAESQFEAPKKSEIFAQAKTLMRSEHTLNFVKDNFRLITMGVDQPHSLELMMDNEIHTFETEAQSKSKMFLGIGDSLPALGIVAAVLGVIITMRSILEPPEILGSMIAAALVGTFTGVLLAYGLINPIGHFLAKYAEEEICYLECIQAGFVSYLYGHPAIVIVEFMRKNIPPHLRPSFHEIDRLLRHQGIKVVG